MKLIITKHNLGLWAAEQVAQRINNSGKNPFVLGLPTGGTVEDMYAALSSLVKHQKVSFKNVVSFNMDEYVGLAPEHDQSYHYYMNYHLFSHIDIDPKNTHILNGQAADLAAECAAYEDAIKQTGGIDLFLGGVGQNGHLAFNEPGSSFDSRTRVVDLTENTIEANSRFFGGDLKAVPTQALSVGVGTVLAAKELLFLASGAKKAEAVAQLTQEGVSTQWPVTALKTHSNATLLVDEAAASLLSGAAKEELEKQKQSNPQGDWILHLG